MNKIDRIIEVTEKRKRKDALSYNPKRVVRKHTCVVCGEEFVSNRRDSKYCSARCRAEAYGLKRIQEHKEEKDRVAKMEKDLANQIEKIAKLTEALEVAKKQIPTPKIQTEIRQVLDSKPHIQKLIKDIESLLDQSTLKAFGESVWVEQDIREIKSIFGWNSDKPTTSNKPKK